MAFDQHLQCHSSSTILDTSTGSKIDFSNFRSSTVKVTQGKYSNLLIWSSILRVMDIPGSFFFFFFFFCYFCQERQFMGLPTVH